MRVVVPSTAPPSSTSSSITTATTTTTTTTSGATTGSNGRGSAATSVPGRILPRSSASIPTPSADRSSRGASSSRGSIGSVPPDLPPSYLNGLKRRWSCEMCRRRKLKCDSVRPSCSFCTSKFFHCVYVGTVTREEYDMEKKTKGTGQVKKPKLADSLAETGLNHCGSFDSISGDSAGAANPQQLFQSLTPSVVESPLLDGISNSPSSIEERPFQLRPHAPEGEELVLIENFFAQKPATCGFIHKRTYLRSHKTMPSFLRYAVCAAGALAPPHSVLADDEIQWYMHRAVQGINSALRDPRIECLQALMILPATSSFMGEKTPSMINSEAGKNLALYLRLNIDPDYLPESSEMSWVEKETRRRCWWYFFLGDNMLTTLIFNRPSWTRGISSVKPVCSERIWSSCKQPDSLRHLYEIGSSINDNPLNWQVKLMEIFSRILLVSLPAENGSLDDSQERRNMEKQLEGELVRWWNIVPSSFWDISSEDSIYETMEEEPYRWQFLMDLYFAYHGCICLLMRRKSLLFLRNLATGTSGPTMATPSLSPTADHAANITSLHSENEEAFNMGVASAEAIANLLALLNRTNAFLHRLPHFTFCFCVQGAMTLLVIHIIFASVLSSDDVDEGGRRKLAGPASLIRQPPSKCLDAYLLFMHSISSNRKLAKFFYTFTLKARAGDWDFFDKIDQNMSALTGEFTRAMTAAAAPFHNGESEVNAAAGSNSGQDAASTNRSNSQFSPDRLFEVFRNSMRENVRLLFTAREIGQTLTPAPSPPKSLNRTIGTAVTARLEAAGVLRNITVAESVRSLKDVGGSNVSPVSLFQTDLAPWLSSSTSLETTFEGFDIVSGPQQTGGWFATGDAWSMGSIGGQQQLQGSLGSGGRGGAGFVGLAGSADVGDGGSLFAPDLFSAAAEAERAYDGIEDPMGKSAGSAFAQAEEANTLLDWLLSTDTTLF
ncbi:hypothetical protein DFJ73DRAFT_823718 [Zopfochytrium polystomum]|nr:hypothetical protein DFJ73DRAFT_823718 [Zopfochytrium polystomum]